MAAEDEDEEPQKDGDKKMASGDAAEGIDDVDEDALDGINFVLTGVFEGITRE